MGLVPDSTGGVNVSTPREPLGQGIRPGGDGADNLGIFRRVRER